MGAIVSQTRRMRTHLAVVAAFALLGSVQLAHAKDKNDPSAILGTYDVRYEEVSSTCTTTSITLSRGTLKISKQKKKLLVRIERFPDMLGSPRGAKIRAASKIESTSIDGLDGKFSVAGRVDEGLIQLVMLGEYYVEGRAYCAQTWNVTGKKQTAAKKAAGYKPPSTPAISGAGFDLLAVINRRRAMSVS